MRIEIIRPNEVRLIAEVGDEIALVDHFTHERLAGPIRLREVPCRIDFNVEWQAYTGWGLYDESGRLVFIGDVHLVRPGDTYSLEVPGR